MENSAGLLSRTRLGIESEIQGLAEGFKHPALALSNVSILRLPALSFPPQLPYDPAKKAPPSTSQVIPLKERERA